MTSKYGSENFSYEYSDLQATTMSLDRTGNFALLAGKRNLAILSVGETPEQIIKVSYGGKYEISNTQWSYKENLAAIASSQRCDIFELTDSSLFKCVHRIKCHSRVITDLDWSKTNPSLLATSSFDNFIHIFDIRTPRDYSAEKPQISISSLDGASQVRWNKWKSDTIASCDGGHVKIFDIRKPNSPSEYIASHASKINGLEWLSRDTIITAAQDCTVKFNRLASHNPNKIKAPCLNLNTPVWRARSCPFGRGIITQCVPILRRDSGGLLLLWDYKRLSAPIFTFQAFDIVEFAWRKSNSYYDLLTWSRDQRLRIWRLPKEIIELCGEELSNINEDTMDDGSENIVLEFDPDGNNENNDEFEEGDSDNEDNLIIEEDIKGKEIIFEEDLDKDRSENKNNIIKSSSNKRSLKHSNSSSPTKAKTISVRDEVLRREFNDLEFNKPENVLFEQIEIEKGMIKFSWRSDPKSRFFFVSVLASFPIGYPSVAPTFLITSCSNDIDKNDVVKQLKQVAQLSTRNHQPCLKDCIKQFASFMEIIKPVEETDLFSAFPSRGVSNIPFPRTSGARFCSSGVLVCFGRPSYLKRIKSNSDAGTPRSLQALGPFLSQLAFDNTDDQSRYQRRSRKSEKTKRSGLVTLFDVSHLVPMYKQLALVYKQSCKPELRKGFCIDNAQSAMNLKNINVAQTWQAASIIANYALELDKMVSTNNKKNSTTNSSSTHVVDHIHHHHPENFVEDIEEESWITYHPLGRNLIHSMITHYAKQGDLQTSATMSCIFSSSSDQSNQIQKNNENNQQNQGASQCGNGANNQNSSKLQPLKNNHLKPPGLVSSPYHTVHGHTDTLHGVVVNPLSDNFFRSKCRSNSWSDSLDEIKMWNSCHSCEAKSETSQDTKSQNLNMLDPTYNHLYDEYKSLYGELLYRWKLLIQRAEVLKCLTMGASNSNVQIDYVILCKFCGESVRGPHCFNCKRIVSICSICHVPAKGLAASCLNCGHLTHSKCHFKWFVQLGRTQCPSGCGCLCLTENNKCFK